VRIAIPILALACASSCDPQKADWGLEAIRTMKTPADPPLACGARTMVDRSSERDRCGFGAGTHPAESLGVDATFRALLPIRHVVVVMKENRSFDHIFGKLHDRGQPNVEAVPPTFSNPDANGNAVFPSHAMTTCILFDPAHQSESMLRCVDDGKMDGFVKNAALTTSSDGTFTMQYNDESDLPFYYWLAKTYAMADRHFAPTVSGTFANRAFMMFGTNAGVVDTGILYPPPSTPSIFHLLMNAGFTWGAYSDGLALSGTLDWGPNEPGVHTMKELLDALDAGTLPNVSFVDGVESWDDDHPKADLQAGEAWLKDIYGHAIASPQWQRMAILFTYDEGGGFADHVPPPEGCSALPTRSPFTRMGPRVPLIAISPWAKRNYASHVVHDHTAITRFIEAVFDLPALTARDANMDALMDLFDFSCGRDLSVGAAPEPGMDGCPVRPPKGTD
jgi:phospholipase C